MQMGLSDTVAEAIEATPRETRPLLYSNVVLCGGTARTPGLLQRLTADLQQRAPADVANLTIIASDPAVQAWMGAASFARSAHYQKAVITKAEYDEQGATLCQKKMTAI